jgi:hypothetical protein
MKNKIIKEQYKSGAKFSATFFSFVLGLNSVEKKNSKGVAIRLLMIFQRSSLIFGHNGCG